MDTIITVSELSKRHSAFTEASLRWLIFRARDNGLDASGAIVRVGRRLLIDEDLFISWLRSNQKIPSN